MCCPRGILPGLKDAIRSFVKGGIEHGVIRVQSYNGGDVEEDLSTAAYQIAREDPTARTWWTI